jgi:tetratricopeptide (TPR) repeat protein
MYYASVGNYKESINLAKSSLENVQKLLGVGALPAADKHYQLGNIFFKIGRKDISLEQYEQTKKILINSGQTSIPEFGIILLKISLICLSFGKIGDCVSNALEAERIFQET